jgi:hypothetical protein
LGKGQSFLIGEVQLQAHKSKGPAGHGSGDQFILLLVDLRDIAPMEYQDLGATMYDLFNF